METEMNFFGPVGNVTGEVKGDQTNVQYNYGSEQKQDLAVVTAEIKQLLEQFQRQGNSLEEAQRNVANQLVTQVRNDSNFLERLVRVGQSLGDTAAKASVTEVVKTVIQLALDLAL